MAACADHISPYIIIEPLKMQHIKNFLAFVQMANENQNGE